MNHGDRVERDVGGMSEHSLYHQVIMEHYKHPHGRGTLHDASVTIEDANPMCGDAITVQLRIDPAGNVVAARHVARGCAISQAGASMVFEMLEGKSAADVLTLPKEEILAEFGDGLSVSRVKCALLGLQAVKKAVIQQQTNEKKEEHARI